MHAPEPGGTGLVEAFNSGNAERVAALYHEDAVNHQVTQDPVEGREAIEVMFAREFSAACLHRGEYL